MAVMPGAQWRPLPRPSATRMARYDLVLIHTMVGSLEGTDGYFRRLTNGVNSHFGTSGDGVLRQWVDTAVRSGANGAGNHRSITVENADMGPGFGPWNTNDGNAVPAFTPAQIEDNAQICAWAHLTHGVPLVAADTSRPNARGIGYHRLGCNPWRVPDGELWSSANGKVCPGPRRIAQIPQIIARARQIVGGAPTPPEDDMSPEERQMLADIHHTLTPGVPNKKDVGAVYWNVIDGRNQAAALRGEIAGLRTALQQLASAPGQAVDLGAVQAAARAGAEEAFVEGVDLNLTVGGQRLDTV